MSKAPKEIIAADIQQWRSQGVRGSDELVRFIEDKQDDWQEMVAEYEAEDLRGVPGKYRAALIVNQTKQEIISALTKLLTEKQEQDVK